MVQKGFIIHICPIICGLFHCCTFLKRKLLDVAVAVGIIESVEQGPKPSRMQSQFTFSELVGLSYAARNVLSYTICMMQHFLTF